MNQNTTWPVSRYIQSSLPCPVRNGVYCATLAGMTFLGSAAYDRREGAERIAAAPTSYANLDLRVDKKQDPLLIRLYKRVIGKNAALAHTRPRVTMFDTDATVRPDGWTRSPGNIAKFIKSYNQLKEIQAGSIKPHLDDDEIKAVKDFYARYAIEVPAGFNFQSEHAFELHLQIQAHGLLEDHLNDAKLMTTESPSEKAQLRSFLSTVVKTRAAIEEAILDPSAFKVENAQLDPKAFKEFLAMNPFPRF